jgi:RimJ/RimL family protein N-acetyltransferase
MATVAVTSAIPFAVEDVRLPRVVADAHHEDAASRRVLDEIWMTFDGIRQIR